MDADDDLVDAANVLFEMRDGGGVLARHGVADGVGDVDRRGAGFDDALDDLGEEVELGAGGVFRRELDVVADGLGALDALDGPADDLVLGHLELELAMDGAGGQEDVDARPRRIAERCPGAVDVVGVAAGQAADDRALDLAGDGLHRLEIARRGDGEAGLDHVHAEFAQGAGDLQLLGQVHAGAGRLFAVAQRGVEDDEAVVGHDRRLQDSSKKKKPRANGPRVIQRNLMQAESALKTPCRRGKASPEAEC